MSMLFVLLDASEVGRIEQRPSGLRFAYSRTWLDAPGAFAVSHSLPLREQPFDQEATRFFGNLLPEGPARTSVARQVGISEDNDFALLRALGQECAGALRIVESLGRPVTRAEPPRLVTDDDLEGWARGSGTAVSGSELRLSLAGAQYKVGVVLDGDDLVLPEEDSASTHLLKLPNRDYAALPQNEALVLALARAIGLDAVESRLWTRGTRAPLLLVTRYDRVGTPVRRLHQEDLCQALGVDRRSKYEIEGGPSFKRCMEIIRKLSSRSILDQRALLRWLAFCVAVGNCDNHAKNLSLLRDDSGRWRLAPFYDLVCTRAYRTLTRRLAMAIGGRTNGDNLPRAAWHDEALEVGVTPKYFAEVASGVAADVEQMLPEVQDELSTQIGSRAALGASLRAIRKCTRTLQRGLA